MSFGLDSSSCVPVPQAHYSQASKHRQLCPLSFKSEDVQFSDRGKKRNRAKYVLSLLIPKKQNNAEYIKWKQNFPLEFCLLAIKLTWAI